MNYAIKGAMAIGLVALGFNLSGCNSTAANAAPEKVLDPAEAAAAALDQEYPQTANAKAPAPVK